MNAALDTRPLLLAAAIESGFAPGRHDDLAEQEYRRIAAMSYSGAKVMLRSPLHYITNIRTPKPPTIEMQGGTATHLALMEPARFASEVVVLPDDAPRRPTSVQINAKKPSPETLEAIHWWFQWDAGTEGKIVLTREHAARVQRMIDAVQSHPAARAWLTDGRYEVSLQWVDGKFAVPCKARIDWLRTDGVFVDVKTSADASPDGFSRSAASLYYHMQAAAYFSGSEHVLDRTPPAWVWVVVESDEPHGVACYVAESPAILAGLRLWDRALERYRDALEAGAWSGYPITTNPLRFPKWALTFPEE